MRNLTKSNVTDAVIHSFENSKSPRLKFIVSRLVTHVHDFAREVNLSHDEWNLGLKFLAQIGHITDDKRNEFVLTSDVLGLSALVDLMNTAPGATQGSALGPFHEAGAPLLENGANLIRNNRGEHVVLQGRVLSIEGEPIAGALLDFWQTAENGLYPQQDSQQDPDNLRCRIHTDKDGRYCLKTIKPGGYPVPYDGPVGALLRAGNRHAWRPAHFHWIVSADNFAPIVTEVFNADDPYIEGDAAFGVRESLIVRFERRDSPNEATIFGVENPFYLVNFDFHLKRLSSPISTRAY
jgi:hydroxyquinol 1,2-dioxygenase